jgi:hypothetical protein
MKIAEAVAIMPDSGVFRESSCEHCSARGTTDGLLTVGAIESASCCGKSVDLWGLRAGITVAAECRTEVINEDEQN